jgi:hypothetical protein
MGEQRRTFSGALEERGEGGGRAGSAAARSRRSVVLRTALHEGRGEQPRAPRALQSALVPAVAALARHHHDVVHLQLQLVLRVRRVRDYAPESGRFKVYFDLKINNFVH